MVIQPRDGVEDLVRWQSACVDQQRRVLASVLEVDYGGSTPKLAEPEGSHCWVWNDRCAPRKVLAGAPLPEDCEDHGLRVRVRRGEKPAPARLRVAPPAMWWEVPESLLPEVEISKSGTGGVLVGKQGAKMRAVGAQRVSPWRSVDGTETVAELELLPAKKFAWKIEAEGQALAHARINLVIPPEGARGVVRLVVLEQADERGTVELVLSEETHSAVVISSNDRLPRVFRRLQDVPPVVELARGIAVSGLLVDSQDRPIDGALVSAQSFIPDGFGMIKRSQMLTGQEGRFALSGIPVGQILLHAQEGERVLRQQLSGRLDRLELQLGRLRLAPITTVAVGVTDAESGGLVENSWAVSEDGTRYRPAKDGLFHLQIEGPELMFSFDAVGYLPQRHSIVVPSPAEAGGDTDPVLIQLQPALVVRGGYVKTDGFTPVHGGRFKTHGAGRTNFDQLTAEGTFDLELLPGAHELELTADDAGRKRLHVEGVGGEVIDLGVIVAPPSLRIVGQVVTADGQPVVGARVTYTRPSELGEVLAWAFGEKASVKTDEAGFFVMEGAELLPSTLRIEAPGWVTRTVVVEPVAGEDLDLGSLELSAGHVVVVRSDDEGATVTLDPGLRNLPQDLLLATISESGARFTAVPAGLLRIRVQVDGQAVCEKEVEVVEDTSFDCQRNAVRLRGRVTVAGEPAAGMLVLQQERAERLPEAVLHQGLGAQQRTRVLSTRPDELSAVLAGDGSYAVNNVLPGRWEVIWMQLDGGIEIAESISVADGSATEIVRNFDFQGVSVAGTVVEENGEVVAGATVELFPGARTQQVDGAGVFGFRGLLSGDYQLRARRANRYSTLVSVHLREGETVGDLVLEMGNGERETQLIATISGGSSGLCFFETDDGLKRVVTIRGEGARLDLRPPLPRSYRVACQVEGRWGFADWRVLDDSPRQEVAIDVSEATASLRFVAAEPALQSIQLSHLGWDLGLLRQWFGGASRFTSEEVVRNLPAGQYLVRVGGQELRVQARARREAAVELPEARP